MKLPDRRRARRVTTAVLTLALVSGCSGAGRPTLSEETTPPPACSADSMAVGDLSAEGLPPPVAATRQAIVRAAVNCDFDALLDLAAAAPVEVAIDGSVVPVADWEAREAQDEMILRPLAGILMLNPAEQASDGSVTWPSAVDWPFSDVAPGDERVALAEVVGEDGIFGWDEVGSYAGWRTTIGSDGTWATVTVGPPPD